MVRWKQKTKIEDLMQRYGWVGTKPQFVDQLSSLIDKMDDPYKTAMQRYYIHSDSQQLDPSTGKPTKDDRRFYQHLVTGRAILDGFFKLDSGDLERLRTLRKRGVYSC